MSARRVYTDDEVEDLIAKVLKSTQKTKKMPDIEKLKKDQDKAILAGELAREKRQHVKELSDRDAPIDEQIAAIGGETLSPLQLVKLRRNTSVGDAGGGGSTGRLEGPSFGRLVLGESPSITEVARFIEISQILRGKSVSMSKNGEAKISGYAIPRSDLVKILQYLIKGTRGRAKPIGLNKIAKLLREGKISLKFPPKIKPYLRQREEGEEGESSSQQEEPQELLTQIMEGLSLKDPPQHGSGLAYLRAACDHAENGDHDEAWDALCTAQQVGAPSGKLKKVEQYLNKHSRIRA